MTRKTKMQLPISMLNIAAPAPKQAWSLPAALNLILGGTAAGYYLLRTLSAQIMHSPSSLSAGLLAISLVLAGFVAVALEAGRPFRARYLFSHWKSSWMSREAITGIFFILAVLTDVLTTSPTVAKIAAIAGLAFMSSQGMMVFRCTAIPIWRDPVMPLLLISSGLAAGYGLLLFNRFGLILPPIGVAFHIDAIGLTSLILNTVAWCVLIWRRYKDADIRTVIRRLRPAIVVIVIGGGQLLPAFLLLALRPWSLDVTEHIRLLLVPMAALTVLAGNFAQKFLLVRVMQYVCSMRLDGEKWK